MNRLTNMVDTVGTTRYTFDGAGRLLTEDGPWASDTVTASYNTAGLRTGLVLQHLTIPGPTASPTMGRDGCSLWHEKLGGLFTFWSAH